LIRLVGVVFSNGGMLSVSDKSDSVNEHIQENNNKVKLHILGAWQNEHEFIGQLVFSGTLLSHLNLRRNIDVTIVCVYIQRSWRRSC